jgi:selenocysteine lyase/cysteine desulfurase
MRRRDFVARAGLLLGTVPMAGTTRVAENLARQAAPRFDPTSWADVRDQFSLSRSRVHMATFLLASHPRPVAEAIARHRSAFDEDPVHHWHEHFMTAEPAQRAAAGAYLGADPDHIALTDSTTMGLGLVYGLLHLEPGDEILTTTHDHYSTEMALRYRADRTGAAVRQVSLYDDPAAASVDEIVSRTRAAITDATRVLAVTWVHSSTGVKLPIAEMSRVVAEANASRDAADRVLFCVDGVHGLGIEDATVDDLRCDFLIAGTHKWLFGPRGTGIVWGRPAAWARMSPIMPSFGASYGVWLGFLPAEQVPVGDHLTPGGFHSFEHRWALDEAFRFHQAIGKRRVQDRIHALNGMTKQALAAMPHVRLQTPMSAGLSAGMVCFDVAGHTASEVEAHLLRRGIVASTTPYRVTHARLAPSLINNEEEVERTVAAIAALA